MEQPGYPGPPPPAGYQQQPPPNYYPQMAPYQAYPPAPGYQAQPPQGYAGQPQYYQPAGTSNEKYAPGIAPPPATGMIAIGMISHTETRKVCQTCKREFSDHVKRYGISTCLLILIILLCFVPLFLLLFICLCEEYKVCPHCGKFSQHEDSNGKGICLC